MNAWNGGQGDFGKTRAAAIVAFRPLYEHFYVCARSYNYKCMRLFFAIYFEFDA